MTDISASAGAGPATATNPALSPERAKLRQAAQAFEAIFIREILSTARATTFGADPIGGADQSAVDQGRDTFTQMRDERFADIASKSGAFGLAARIEAQLARALPIAATAASSAAAGSPAAAVAAGAAKAAASAAIATLRKEP
ncbi:rod-binding protein [Novosphingobium sp. FKTRR1]|uniref:rod-binding protein n=1 Tax=unclassified Novosphingobium TaxID=2644732 RepID=UPI001CF026F7|nr:rod-binding protein [Novosphingobium sp. FKTRR1]